MNQFETSQTELSQERDKYDSQSSWYKGTKLQLFNVTQGSAE